MMNNPLRSKSLRPRPSICEEIVGSPRKDGKRSSGSEESEGEGCQFGQHGLVSKFGCLTLQGRGLDMRLYPFGHVGSYHRVRARGRSI